MRIAYIEPGFQLEGPTKSEINRWLDSRWRLSHYYWLNWQPSTGCLAASPNTVSTNQHLAYPHPGLCSKWSGWSTCVRLCFVMAALLFQSSPSVTWAAYTWHVAQQVCVVHRLAGRMTKHPLYLDRCVTKAVESPYAKCQDELRIDIYPAVAKGSTPLKQVLA